MPIACSRSHRLRRLRPDGVRHGEGREDPRVPLEQVDDALSARGRRLGGERGAARAEASTPSSRAGSAHRPRARRPSTARPDSVARAWPRSPWRAGRRARARARCARSPARPGARSRARPRRRGGAPRAPAARPTVAHRHDAVLAQGERPGLVEHHRRRAVARLLQPPPVAHQEPAPRAERGRDGDHERHGEPERVRAGDHEHRDQPLDREGGIRPADEPRDQRDGARARARRG